MGNLARGLARLLFWFAIFTGLFVLFGMAFFSLLEYAAYG